VSISFDNQNGDRYMVLPVPYEKGWEVTVNGKPQTVHKANYAFIGFSIEKGKNDIRLVYYPPYFKAALPSQSSASSSESGTAEGEKSLALKQSQALIFSEVFPR
jgi:hypothetical protein